MEQVSTKTNTNKKISNSTKQNNALKQRKVLRLSTLIVMLFILCALFIASASLGQFHINTSDVYKFLFNIGDPSSQEYQVFWFIRMPRIVMVMLVGASLGVGGAIMQAIFANPLAEPGIIGVSSGCAVGASIAIVMNWTFLSLLTVPISAFVTGIIVTFAIYQMSKSGGKARVITLILTGIAVNALCGAMIAFFTYAAPTTARNQIVFWQMGSLNGANWQHIIVVTPIVIFGLIVSFYIAPKLDLLALGEDTAKYLGLNVPRLRFTAICMTALLTAGAVSFAGIITFVGLIVPHLLRLIIGPMNSWLIPLSAVGGIILVGSADLIARTAMSYADLPIGIFTAIIGSVVFFIVMKQNMLKVG